MSYLILVRHGQSVWNLEKKFTGWVDVDLTENGKLEAKKAGDLIKTNNINTPPIQIINMSFRATARISPNSSPIISKRINDKKLITTKPTAKDE